MSKRARRGRATAELILRNGVVKLDAAATHHPNAVALRGGRVMASGDDAVVMRHRGPRTRVIDLHGRAIAPRTSNTQIVRVLDPTVSREERSTLPGLGPPPNDREEVYARAALLRRLRAMES